MQPPDPIVRCLTTKAVGIVRALISACDVCTGHDPATTPLPHPAYEPFRAIWDTGATNCVITQAIVDRCGLKASGLVLSHHAQGSGMAETFDVNLRLPNNVHFFNLPVTLGILPHGAHALIGMDVIGSGDFSITNVGGRTMFSFRHPSMGGADFVAELNRQNLANRPRNAVIPSTRHRGRT